MPTMRRSTIRRNFGLLLLSGIFTLNVYMFFTLPSSRLNDVYPRDNKQAALLRDSRAVSHLQFPRKRLNKSNFTSDSLGAEVGIVGAAGGAAWEDGVGDQHPLDLRDTGKTSDLKTNETGQWEGREGQHAPLVLRDPNKRHDIRTKNGKWEKGGGESISLVRQNRNRVLNPPNPKTQAEGDDLPQKAPPERRQAAKDTQDDEKSKIVRKTTTPVYVNKNYTDPQVDAFVKMLEEKEMLDVLPGRDLQQENYWSFLQRQRERRKAGTQLPAYRNYRARTNWQRFHKEIHQHYLYNPDSPTLQNVLNDLAQRKIVDVEQKDGGTQIKLIVSFDDDGKALFKPMRFPREMGTLPDHFYFADYERHISEIAAFHLDRILGYNRVPPVAGRVVNMTRDIKELADNKLTRTFFISPAGNLCFHGTCSYYCDSSHPICGHPDQLEASLMAFLPPETMAYRMTWRNPWKRSYSKHRKAYWEAYDDLCEKIKKRPPFNTGRRLLDIVDMSILDFLMGNLDRHHYETFRSFGNDTFILHLDHGRGFGKAHEDDMSCLAPLLQCCMVRMTTLQRLARLYGGPYPLSLIMKVTMSHDQVNPVLIEPHLQALDRRLMTILKSVMQCTQQGGRTLGQVIVDDGVY